MSLLLPMYCSWNIRGASLEEVLHAELIEGRRPVEAGELVGKTQKSTCMVKDEGHSSFSHDSSLACYFSVGLTVIEKLVTNALYELASLPYRLVIHLS